MTVLKLLRRLLRGPAADARRYAGEISVATVRADDAAQRWLDRLRRAEQHTDQTWQDWQDAEQRLARTRSAAAFPVPWNPQTPTEYADRERFLHLSVSEAIDRGDLPATVMIDLLAGEGGWNPRLHPVEQELVLHRAFAAVRHHLYRQAVDAEQTARHDARLAVAARDSLRREAIAVSAQYRPARERRVMPARRRSWVHQPA